jgi:hypothetical protein
MVGPLHGVTRLATLPREEKFEFCVRFKRGKIGEAISVGKTKAGRLDLDLVK